MKQESDSFQFENTTEWEFNSHGPQRGSGRLRRITENGALLSRRFLVTMKS